MKSQNNITTKNLNEESQNLSENQPEQNCSQKQSAATVTNLNNNEESTCKNVPEQQNVEKIILKAKKRQTTMTEFANSANKTQENKEGTTNKRKNESFELLSAPSKKRPSSSRKKQFDFSTAKKLFDDEPSNDMDVVEITSEPFVFGEENSKTKQQHPKQKTTLTTGESSKTSQQYPKHKPPPIVISSGSAADIRRCANEVNNQPRSFLIDIKKDKQGTKKVTTDNWNDYHKFVKLLETKKHRFHTYSTEEPQMKFVLYGLPAMELEELEKALKAEKVSPVKIVKMTMKQRRHSDDQNYLLYFKNNNQEGEQSNLMKILENIKSVDGFKVKWDKYKNKRSGPSQCSNCLQFGHGQRGCKRLPTCFRCSEQHDSKTCPHISQDNNKVPLDKLKCHFCGEKHTAISQVCKTRLQIIEKWKGKSINGNNRNHNKPASRYSQNQIEQRRSIPSTPRTSERSNKSVHFVQQKHQNRNNVATTSQAPISVNQNSAPVKPKQQNTNTSSTNKPVVQRQQNPMNNQRKKRRNNKNKKSKRNNKNQNQVVQEMETEIISSPTLNETIAEPSTSSNTEQPTSIIDAPAQSTSNRSESESSTTRCMHLLKELFKIIAQNPECLNFVQQAIGSIANEHHQQS